MGSCAREQEGAAAALSASGVIRELAKMGGKFREQLWGEAQSESKPAKGIEFRRLVVTDETVFCFAGHSAPFRSQDSPTPLFVE